jgi:hypothetical protein
MWGCVEDRDEDGAVDIHVVPMVDIDGELQVSAAHMVSLDCPCRPTRKLDHKQIVNHHDPDHPGAE